MEALEWEEPLLLKAELQARTRLELRECVDWEGVIESRSSVLIGCAPPPLPRTHGSSFACPFSVATPRGPAPRPLPSGPLVPCIAPVPPQCHASHCGRSSAGHKASQSVARDTTVRHHPCLKCADDAVPSLNAPHLRHRLFKGMICERCDDVAAAFFCGVCHSYLCRACSSALHMGAKGARWKFKQHPLVALGDELLKVRNPHDEFQSPEDVAHQRAMMKEGGPAPGQRTFRHVQVSTLLRKGLRPSPLAPCRTERRWCTCTQLLLALPKNGAKANRQRER